MNSNDAPKQNVIPATQRPDGTLRKERQVKPGYVNQDEVPKYVIPSRREEDKNTKPEEAPQDGKTQDVAPESEDKKQKRQRNRKKKENNPNEVNEGEEETKAETSDKDVKRKDSQKDAADGEKELSETEKQMRKLKKKLRQIEDLEKKKASGSALNEEELSKLKSKTDVLRQINDLKVK